MRGEHLDHLALHQRPVHVHDHEPHAVAQQVRRLYGHVDLLPRGLLGEHHPQPVGVGAGHVEVERSHRIARHPLDAVDVGADVGYPSGDGRHRRGA